MRAAAPGRPPARFPRVAAESGPFGRPRLFSESGRVVRIHSNGGVAGSGGLVPSVVAVEPPVAGNPSFTIGIDHALGGAAATLVLDAGDPGVQAFVPTSAALAVEATTLAGAEPGGGTGSVAIVFPASGELVGTPLVGRWYVEDPAAPDGLAISPAFELEIFGGVVPVFFDDFESGGTGTWTDAAL